MLVASKLWSATPVGRNTRREDAAAAIKGIRNGFFLRTPQFLEIPGYCASQKLSTSVAVFLGKLKKIPCEVCFGTKPVGIPCVAKKTNYKWIVNVSAEEKNTSLVISVGLFLKACLFI